MKCNTTARYRARYGAGLVVRITGRVAMPLYSHLSSDERSEIAVFSAAGYSISVIARSLGRAK